MNQYHVLFILIATLLVAGCTSMKQETNQIPRDGYLTTLEGTYEASPMGPRVAGMILIEFGVDNSLIGKTVRITGNVYEFHEFRCKPYVEGTPVEQCFDGPLMRNATIRVLQ